MHSADSSRWRRCSSVVFRKNVAIVILADAGGSDTSLYPAALAHPCAAGSIRKKMDSRLRGNDGFLSERDINRALILQCRAKDGPAQIHSRWHAQSCVLD